MGDGRDLGFRRGPGCEAERQRGASFVAEYAPGDEAAGWAAFARALFASNEFLTIE